MSHERPLVYVDLDRTLFRTSLIKQLWGELGRLYPDIDVKAAYTHRAEYYRTLGDLYSHDMTAQLQSIGISADEAYVKLHEQLRDGRFEYEGATELMSWLKQAADVRVLTFGFDDYQRFKASLCPSLRGIPVVTTLLPKREHFSLENKPCWLIDDKPVGSELPAFVRFIQVSLEGKPQPDTVAWPVFTHLNEVKEYLHANLH
ncbi:MAG TPA: hypothetical protein VF597_00150 [Candidatus Saccharimonadales bacterium]|jgi:hypothetical protein